MFNNAFKKLLCVTILPILWWMTTTKKGTVIYSVFKKKNLFSLFLSSSCQKTHNGDQGDFYTPKYCCREN